MTIPSPPPIVPECGIIQPDGTVKVTLNWRPSPEAVSQDLGVWPLGVSDDIDNAVFGVSFASGTSSIEVGGLEQGKIYFWSIVTNSDIPSEFSWFRTKASGGQPLPPVEGAGIPVWLLLAAGGIVVFLIATKKLYPEESTD